MNLIWPAIGIAVTTALAVTAMLLVRRSAPEGSRFTDGDRAVANAAVMRRALLEVALLGAVCGPLAEGQ